MQKKILIASFFATMLVLLSFQGMAADSSLVKDNEEEKKSYFVKPVVGSFTALNDISEEDIDLIIQTASDARNELSQIQRLYGDNFEVDNVLITSSNGNDMEIVANLPVVGQPMTMAGMGIGCSVLLASILAMAIIALAAGVASIPLGDVAGWIAFFLCGAFGAWAAALVQAFNDLGCEFPSAASTASTSSQFQSTPISLNTYITSSNIGCPYNQETSSRMVTQTTSR